MQVAFLGLGKMGRAMAARLVGAGVSVRTWTRSGAVVEGAESATSIEKAARGADVAITMLSEDAALRAVTVGEEHLLQVLASGAMHVNMGTISVHLAGELASLHLAAGQRFVNAPVFGRPESAAAGQLWILGGGSADDLQRLAPLFAVLGQGTLPFANARQSALAKLCGNFLIMGLIELLAESMTLAEKGGIPPRQVLEMLTTTLFNLPVVHGYGGMIARQEFEPAGFALPLGLKDARLLLEAGDALRVPLPVAAMIRERFIEALAAGREDQDWSSIAAMVREDAGL